MSCATHSWGSRIVLDHSRSIDRVLVFSWEEEKEASTWASAKLLVWITGRGRTLAVGFSDSLTQSHRLNLRYTSSYTSINIVSGSWKGIIEWPKNLKFTVFPLRCLYNFSTVVSEPRYSYVYTSFCDIHEMYVGCLQFLIVYLKFLRKSTTCFSKLI